ncbi:MAG: FGGY family carbohydrate kinase, partial [Chloroflexota bacterium]|nr:FGGY family carbohydrate kinase [Chloroflexota bacterium]
MSKYVAAIDQGTTSTRCMIFDRSSQVIAVEQLEHRQIFPRAGWVEHDPLEIWGRVQEVIAGALAKANATPHDLAALGIT